MKDQKARARDIERAWEQLEARVAAAPSVFRLAGFRVAGPGSSSYRAGSILVEARVETLDGELWLRLDVMARSVRPVTLAELTWAAQAFGGHTGALIIRQHQGDLDADYASVVIPLERNPLPPALAERPSHRGAPYPTG